MMPLLQLYVKAAQQAGVEIDEELLGPLVEKSQGMGMMRQATE